MTPFVVLLRGVNVGKANRVPMATLRALLEAEGFAQVRTLLNSGNAVGMREGPGSASTASAHAAAIESRLRAQLGLAVPVVVQSASDFEAAIAEMPWQVPEAEHSSLLVAFAQGPDTLVDLGAVQALVGPTERFAIGKRAAYLACAGGILESKAATALLGQKGRAVTTRNWATALKLRAMLASAGT